MTLLDHRFVLHWWLPVPLPSDVFEKDVAIPGQQWESSFKPTFNFNIREQDTARLYNIYLVLRHTDAYNYNNIWIGHGAPARRYRQPQPAL